MPTLPRLPLGLALSALLCLILTGCGGKGASSADGVPADLQGRWTVILNEGQVNELTIPLTLAGDSGSIAGQTLRDVDYSTAGEAPTLRFGADALTVEGVAGSTIQVPGPTIWTAVQQDGRLVGSVEGPQNIAEPWIATRSGQ